MGQLAGRSDPVRPHPSAGQRNWLIATISAQPHRDDLWLIPADQRFAAHRSIGTIAEVALPTRVVDGTAGQPLTGPRHALTRELARSIRQLTGRTDITERHLAESLTTALRLHLIEAFTAGSGAVDDAFDDATKQRLLEYIDRGADVDTSQPALARHLGMPVRAFARAFAAAYRTTPHQFVMDRRIARAKSLLRTTAESVTDIGLSVGFSTPSHFSTVFKNRIGVTPTQYRENPDRPTLHAGRSAGRSGDASLPPIRRTLP